MAFSSKARLIFNVVDYSVAKNSYHLKLIDTTRRASFNFVLSPFDMHTSVMVLDFMMADVERHAEIRDDMVQFVKDDTGATLNDFMVIGDRATTISNMECATVDATRAHNTRKLSFVSDISVSRELIKSLDKGSCAVGVRVVDGVMHIDNINHAHRSNKAGLTVSKETKGKRKAEVGAEIPVKLSDYVRDDVSHMTVTYPPLTANRDYVMLGNVDNPDTLIKANRDYREEATLLADLHTLSRETGNNLVHLMDGVKKFNRLNTTKSFIDRGLIDSRRSISNVMFNDKTMHQYSRLVSNIAHIEHVGVANRNIRELAFILSDTPIGRIMARQYQATVHNPNVVADRLLGVSTTLQSVIAFNRSHRGAQMSKGHESLLAVRDITSQLYNLNTLRVLSKYKAVKINKGTIERMLIEAHRSIQSKAVLTGKQMQSDRLYVVRGHKDNLISEGDRSAEFGMHLNNRIKQGNRDNASKMDLASSDGYSRDIESGLYLPSGTQGVRDSEHQLHLTESAQGYKGKGVDSKKLSVVRQKVADRKAENGAHIVGGVESTREVNRKMSVNDSLLQFYRDILKCMHYKDFSGITDLSGELILNMLDSMLMDEMLFGEVISDFAFIEEHIIMGSRENSSDGNLSEDYLCAVTERINTLVDCGILKLADKEGKDGDILVIDYTAIKEVKDGELDNTDLLADIEGLGIPKPGWLDNLVNPMGWLDGREGSVESSEVGYRQDKDANITQDATLLFSKETREGSTSEVEVLGDRTITEGTFLETGVVGERSAVPGILQPLTEFVGEVAKRGGTLVDNLKSIMGSVVERFGNFMGSTKLGAVPDKEGQFMEGSSEYTVEPRYGDTDSTPVLGGVDNRQGDTTALESEFLGQRIEGLGDIQSSTLEGSVENRFAETVIDFVFASTESKQAVKLEELLSMVSEERAHTLLTFMPVAERDSFSALIEKGMEGESYKLADVVDGILGINEKEGELGQGILGKGTLFDYNDDLLTETGNVENWGKQYGFGVPDDYDPIDPFNNYFPYTSDYAPHDMTQNINWSADSSFEFVKDTDTLKFNSANKGMAITELKGDNYKFSTKFRVTGNSDKAVDIIVKHTSDNDYLLFRIHGGDMADSLGMVAPMQLFRVFDGNYEAIGYPMSPETWKYGEWHRVSVSVMENGNRLRVVMDDKLQYDVRGY